MRFNINLFLCCISRNVTKLLNKIAGYRPYKLRTLSTMIRDNKIRIHIVHRVGLLKLFKKN